MGTEFSKISVTLIVRAGHLLFRKPNIPFPGRPGGAWRLRVLPYFLAGDRRAKPASPHSQAGPASAALALRSMGFPPVAARGHIDDQWHPQGEDTLHPLANHRSQRLDL